jgi:hypothetical protein
MNVVETKDKINSSIKKYKDTRDEISQLYIDLLKYQYNKIKDLTKAIGGLTLNISYSSNDEGGTKTYYNPCINGYYFDIDCLEDYFEESEVEKLTEEQKENFKEFSESFDDMLGETYLDCENIAFNIGIKESSDY